MGLASRFLTIPLDFYATTVSQDATGAPDRTIPGSPTALGILCCVSPMGAAEQLNYERRGIRANFAIYLEADLTQAPPKGIGGQLTVGYMIKDPAKGWQYDVQAVEYDDSGGALSLNPYTKVVAYRVI